MLFARCWPPCTTFKCKAIASIAALRLRFGRIQFMIIVMIVCSLFHRLCASTPGAYRIRFYTFCSRTIFMSSFHYKRVLSSVFWSFTSLQMCARTHHHWLTRKRNTYFAGFSPWSILRFRHHFRLHKSTIPSLPLCLPLPFPGSSVPSCCAFNLMHIV